MDKSQMKLEIERQLKACVQKVEDADKIPVVEKKSKKTEVK